MKPLLAPDSTLGYVLTRHKETASVFVRLRMACVGCPMSSFETLEDAARIYGLPLTELVTALEQVISNREGQVS